MSLFRKFRADFKLWNIWMIMQKIRKTVESLHEKLLKLKFGITFFINYLHLYAKFQLYSLKCSLAKIIILI